MITGDAILAHMVGDYVLQSDWMAMNKTKSWKIAATHVLIYGLPFLLLMPSAAAWLFIVTTHFIIDHWRLARHVGWAKNFLAPAENRPPPFAECSGTGYPPSKPDYMAVWLMIIVDQVLHLICNGIALTWM